MRKGSYSEELVKIDLRCHLAEPRMPTPLVVVWWYIFTKTFTLVNTGRYFGGLGEVFLFQLTQIQHHSVHDLTIGAGGWRNFPNSVKCIGSR